MNYEENSKKIDISIIVPVYNVEEYLSECVDSLLNQVFYIPKLAHELEKDLDKPDNQIWVGRYIETEINYPTLKNTDFKELFDLWMSYGDNTEIFCEPMRKSFIEKTEEQKEHLLVRLCRKVDIIKKILLK